MTDRHTPGPWVIDSFENETLDFAISGTGRMTDYSIYPSNGKRMPIASIQHCFNGPRTRANASLIGAAPELLRALQDIVRVYGPDSGPGRVAVAAIRKATGGKT